MNELERQEKYGIVILNSWFIFLSLYSTLFTIYLKVLIFSILRVLVLWQKKKKKGKKCPIQCRERKIIFNKKKM